MLQKPCMIFRDWGLGMIYEQLIPSALIFKSKQDCHHQNNRYYSDGEPASAQQLMYFATCSFNSCGEQSHKDSVQPAVENYVNVS